MVKPAGNFLIHQGKDDLDDGMRSSHSTGVDSDKVLYCQCPPERTFAMSHYYAERVDGLHPDKPRASAVACMGWYLVLRTKSNTMAIAT